MNIFNNNSFKKDRRVADKSQKDQIIKKQKNYCACCKTKITPKTCEIDHIKPYSWGGPTDDLNLQALCKKCHKEKTKRQRGVIH